MTIVVVSLTSLFWTSMESQHSLLILDTISSFPRFRVRMSSPSVLAAASLAATFLSLLGYGADVGMPKKALRVKWAAFL